MKITSINAANTNLTAITNRKTVMNSANTENVKENRRRFDTFTMINADNHKTAKGLSSEKAELIRNLDNLSEEEKAEVAVASYIDMQKCCKSALDRYETDIYSFKSLQEKKAYYTELKSQGGVISEEGGKYGFAAASAGSSIDEKEIDAALSEVQGRLDSLMMSPTEETAKNELNDKIFRNAASAFAKATGISDDALNLEDDSLCKVKEGLTEENYLEKMSEAVNSIKNRSQQLTNVMNDYIGTNSYAKDMMNNPNELLKNSQNAEKSHLAEVLEQYLSRLESSDSTESSLLSNLLSQMD